MSKSSTRRALSESELFAGSTVKEAGKKGLGLFAQRDFPCGAVVTRMLCPTCVTTTTSSQLVEWWEKHIRKAGVPNDSAIFLYRSKTICKRLVYDAAFASKHEVPPWYRINHSSVNHNVRPRWTGDLKLPKLEFVAIDDIRQGEEIQFAYGQPDPSWEA